MVDIGRSIEESRIKTHIRWEVWGVCGFGGPSGAASCLGVGEGSPLAL